MILLTLMPSTKFALVSHSSIRRKMERLLVLQTSIVGLAYLVVLLGFAGNFQQTQGQVLVVLKV